LEVDKMGNFHFDAHYEERYLARVSLGVPGLHNVRNALAALASCICWSVENAVLS